MSLFEAGFESGQVNMSDRLRTVQFTEEQLQAFATMARIVCSSAKVREATTGIEDPALRAYRDAQQALHQQLSGRSMVTPAVASLE